MRLISRLAAVLAGIGLLLAVAGTASANVVITVNKATQRMTVAVDGKPRYNWPVSTGKVGYSTPSGSYRPFRLERDHRSTEWDDAPMPHSIFFTGRGHAIHGSYDRRLGRAVSHGCVRLSPSNAATLFALVQSEGLGNTRVVITGPSLGLPKVDLSKVKSKLPKIGKPSFPKIPRPKFADWLDD